MNEGQIQECERMMETSYIEAFYNIDERQTIVYNLNEHVTEHHYELNENGAVVIDKLFGLYWQRSGSKGCNYEEAGDYIRMLNQKKYSGYSDWRLPTVEEAMSLMKPTPIIKPKGISYDIYIDQIFDYHILGIWTCDKYENLLPWVVMFCGGTCKYSFPYGHWYVRAVR